MKYHSGRVAVVTVGLSGAGAASGFLAGSTGLFIALQLNQPFGEIGSASVYGFAGLVGSILGAVCGPLAGWLLLRTVPLGKLFVLLTCGTIIGGVTGWFLLADQYIVAGPVAAAVAGFLASAIVLRLTHRSRMRLRDRSTIAVAVPKC